MQEQPADKPEPTIPEDIKKQLTDEARTIAGLPERDMTAVGPSLGIEGLTGNTIRTQEETNLKITPKPKDGRPTVSPVDLIGHHKNATPIKTK